MTFQLVCAILNTEIRERNKLNIIQYESTESLFIMKKELEVIAEINGVKFYKGNIIDNGNKKELLIMTDDENFRIDIDEDINKAINRIYNNYYA